MKETKLLPLDALLMTDLNGSNHKHSRTVRDDLKSFVERKPETQRSIGAAIVFRPETNYQTSTNDQNDYGKIKRGCEFAECNRVTGNEGLRFDCNKLSAASEMEIVIETDRQTDRQRE
jgi:hypothetical protein